MGALGYSCHLQGFVEAAEAAQTPASCVGTKGDGVGGGRHSLGSTHWATAHSLGSTMCLTGGYKDINVRTLK